MKDAVSVSFMGAEKQSKITFAFIFYQFFLRFFFISNHSGDAMQMDEYVPLITPTISGNAKSLISATPNT